MIQPSLPAVLRAAFDGAPGEARRSALTGLLIWLLLMILQAFDSANDRGPAAAAEFFSALCGSAGGILLAFTGLLNASAERTAGARRHGQEGDGYRRVLLALPAVGLLAGTLLSAAVALMVVRAFLGAALPFVIVLTTMYAVLLGLAAATVMRAARVLYAHAQTEAHNASVARMNPHFLFNALNTVAALVRSEPAAAERVVENLAGVLRATLDRSAERSSTVGAEIEYLRAWLAVEQERWKERLRIEWQVPPDTLSAVIPPLTLQPLVENALRHGVGARIDGGTIAISASRDAKQLVLRVADDGVGFPAAHAERTGLGSLRQRLGSMYGDDASVTIEAVSSGAVVTVRVPFDEGDARAGR